MKLSSKNITSIEMSVKCVTDMEYVKCFTPMRFLEFSNLHEKTSQKRWLFGVNSWKLHPSQDKDGHFWQKWLFLDHKKWHFWWQNQNSKTTFIVQTFPKYCRKGFYFMKLSLLSPILAKFQFCWFSGLFWAFFPCKKCKK